MENRQNHLLNSVKLYMAFLIVCIHMPFPGEVGIVLRSFARVSVPFFLITSGFYLWNDNLDMVKVVLQKRIKKLLSIIVFLNFIYFIQNVVYDWIENGISLNYFSESLSIRELIKLIVFNQPYWGKHLWYIHAMLYVYLVYGIVLCLGESKRAKIIRIIPLLLLGFVVDDIIGYMNLKFMKFSLVILRNAYFDALPFFTIGFIIAKNMERIRKIVKSIKDKYIYLCLLVLCLFQIIEGFLLSSEMYISTIPLSIVIFIVVQIKQKNVNATLVSRLGKLHSGIIYMIHPMVITSLILVASRYNIDRLLVYKWSAPIIIFISSLLISIVFHILFVKHNKRTGVL